MDRSAIREKRCITLGYASHRPETLALAEPVMERHEAIILEEPPTPWFSPMLRSELELVSYLRQGDFQFPAFTYQACLIYRRLKQEGKHLFQCEPYLERLDAIRERFAAGARPEDIAPQSELGTVYACERRWTAALLAFYQDSLQAPFATVVERLKAFARADASRNRLRDTLRAVAIGKLATPFASLYVEAGSLHIYLINRLRRLLGQEYAIVPCYLTAPVIKRIGGRRRAFGPGELLTLHYTYRPQFSSKTAERLAAQSLIHSRIELKGEVEGDDFPHTRDEVACAALVADLEYADCQRLYALIKGRGALESRECLKAYLKRYKEGW
jgi:hypothetical protein